MGESSSRRTLLLISKAVIFVLGYESQLGFYTTPIPKTGIISQPRGSKQDLAFTEYRSRCSADLREYTSRSRPDEGGKGSGKMTNSV